VCLPGDAFGELVTLTSGQTVSVRSVRVADGTAVLQLRAGGEMSCAATLIQRIAADEVVYPAPAVVAEAEPDPDADPAPPRAATAGDAPSVPAGYSAMVADAARRHHVDPRLVHAVISVESRYQPSARSRKGAIGLMQLMPATARRFGVTKIYDPKQNIDAGVRYMRWLLDTFQGDVVLALAGYNAGEGAVMRYGGNVPPYRETREYVRRITSRYFSISSPGYVESARRTSNTLAANLNQKDSRPLTVFEQSPIINRTADGKLILVNQ